MFVYIVTDREGRIDKVFDSLDKAHAYIDKMDPLWERYKHDVNDRYYVTGMKVG